MMFTVHLDQRRAKMYAVYLGLGFSVRAKMFDARESLAAFGRRRSADLGQLGVPA
jgi:hypothetical protein